MSISLTKLQEVAKLAALSVDEPVITERLIKDIEQIMDLVDKLKSIDVNNVSPMSHPMTASSRFREDTVQTFNEIKDLALNAPLFSDDGLFLVPKDVGNQDAE